MNNYITLDLNIFNTISAIFKNDFSRKKSSIHITELNYLNTNGIQKHPDVRNVFEPTGSFENQNLNMVP